MTPASISEIKNAIKNLGQKELIEICLRLARYKKENKELITFLLFEASDLELYIRSVKEEMDEGFAAINMSNMHFVKKSVRKILRIANKHIRHSGSKSAEAEILLHFATSLKALQIPLQKSTALLNLYNTQVKKIQAAIDTMHEDLKYDYQKELERL